MDKKLQVKVDNLLKSLSSKVKKIKKKNPIEDVLDSDRVAEVSPDSIGSHISSTINNKNEEQECQCKGEKDCECDEAPMDKSEKIAKDILESFKKVSKAYFEKKEKLEKAKIDEGLSAGDKKTARKERNKNYEPKTKEKFTADGHREYKIKPSQEQLKQKLKDKPKVPSKEDLEYPMAASEDKKSKKPFHGYNKNKHSKEGGLSEKAREKYNRETGSNLKAPVSSKEAKNSPKKAARRKSFCARMSGVKGSTSKEGKLTPKGAALKRWDC